MSRSRADMKGAINCIFRRSDAIDSRERKRLVPRLQALSLLLARAGGLMQEIERERECNRMGIGSLREEAIEWVLLLLLHFLDIYVLLRAYISGSID